MAMSISHSHACAARASKGQGSYGVQGVHVGSHEHYQCVQASGVRKGLSLIR